MSNVAQCVLLADRHHSLSEGVRGLLETAFGTIFMVADEASLLDGVSRLAPSATRTFHRAFAVRPGREVDSTETDSMKRTTTPSMLIGLSPLGDCATRLVNPPSARTEADATARDRTSGLTDLCIART